MKMVMYLLIKPYLSDYIYIYIYILITKKGGILEYLPHGFISLSHWTLSLTSSQTQVLVLIICIQAIEILQEPVKFAIKLCS